MILSKGSRSVMIAFLGTESVYIDVLWVEENLQKQGYGTKLLEAVATRSHKKGMCLFFSGYLGLSSRRILFEKRL